MTPTSQWHGFVMPWEVGFLTCKICPKGAQRKLHRMRNWPANKAGRSKILFAMKKRNFIWRQVGKRRNELEWTQNYLADRLEDAGWQNATRSTVSKIEDGSLRIDLTQLYYLAVALRVHPIHFLPKMDWSKPVKTQIYSQ